MSFDDTIQNELAQVAPLLLKIDRRNLYVVPKHYFNSLDGNLFSVCMGLENKKSIASLPYFTPAEYFDKLPSCILHKIKTQDQQKISVCDLDEIAPTLKLISRDNIYSVPDGYFDNITTEFQKQQNVRRRVPFNKYLKYAVAAIVTSIVAVSALMFSNKDKVDHLSFFANVKSFNPADVRQLSEADIADFLSVHSSSTDVGNLSNNIYPEPDIEQTVKDISDSEILNYLDETSEPDEVIYKKI